MESAHQPRPVPVRSPSPDPATTYVTKATYLPAGSCAHEHDGVPLDALPRLLRGVHVSSEGGLAALRARMRDIAGLYDGVQCFGSSPKRAAVATQYQADDVAAFTQMFDKAALRDCVMHATHATNLASADDDVAGRAEESIIDEMRKCAVLGIPTLCIHLGSALEDEDEDSVLERVGRRIVRILDEVPNVNIGMENMLHHLGQIIDDVGDERLMVCLDLCHAYIADYDLFCPADRRRMFDEIEQMGWDRIAAVHVSDSTTLHGDKVDGHIGIGRGLIQLPALRHILRHPGLLGRVPYILETPDYFRGQRENSDLGRAIKADEADRRLDEWRLLERVILMTDDAWAAEVAAQDAERELARARPATVARAAARAAKPLRCSHWADHTARRRVIEARIKAKVQRVGVPDGRKGAFRLERTDEKSRLGKVHAARRHRADLPVGRPKGSVKKDRSPCCTPPPGAGGLGINKDGARWMSGRHRKHLASARPLAAEGVRLVAAPSLAQAETTSMLARIVVDARASQVEERSQRRAARDREQADAEARARRKAARAAQAERARAAKAAKAAKKAARGRRRRSSASPASLPPATPALRALAASPPLPPPRLMPFIHETLRDSSSP